MVSPSDNAISRRIDDMAHDSEEVLCGKLKYSSFSHQADESIDLTNKCNVVAFVRVVNDGEFKENFLCCKELLSEQRNRFIPYFILVSGNKRSLLVGLCWHLFCWCSING